MNIFLILIIIWVFGFIIYGVFATNDCMPKNYVGPLSELIWPISITMLLINYLKTKQFNKMNYKILGKAMGFMFAPTLGILLMLLVGFFDPIAMWTFIKSDTAGAVITRLVMFVLEVGFVIGLYVSYMEEESKKEVLDQINSGNIGEAKEITHNDYISNIIRRDNYDDKYVYYNTHNPDIKIIERKPKK